MSLRPFALRGRLGNRSLRRFLLRGADRVEALQRLHQVDDPGWCLDRWRDDLFAGDFGVDDPSVQDRVRELVLQAYAENVHEIAETGS